MKEESPSAEVSQSEATTVEKINPANVLEVSMNDIIVKQSLSNQSKSQTGFKAFRKNKVFSCSKLPSIIKYNEM